MDTNLNVAVAPKDTTFQVRINSEIKRAEKRADTEGWINSDDLERELGVKK